MISWGTSYDFIGEYSSVSPEECKICSDQNKPVYKGEQAYFKLYGMGIFPTGKSYFKTCTSCNTRLKVKSNDINLSSVKNALPGKNKFKYFAGWVVIIIVAMLILWLYLEYTS